MTLTFGAIGFSDDYLKLTRGKGLGLSGPAKLVWSFSCAFVAAAWLFLYLGFDTHLTVPFLKNVHPDLHWWFYIPFAMLVIVGCSHAVNLTDGLDGLAIGPVMTVALTYWVFTYVAGNVKFANYLQIPHIADVGEVAIFCASLIAASLGFLWFNAYPASMMMGDVGALVARRRDRHGRGAVQAGTGAGDRGRSVRRRSGVGHNPALLLQGDA